MKETLREIIATIREFEAHSNESGDPIGGCNICFGLFKRLLSGADALESLLYEAECDLVKELRECKCEYCQARANQLETWLAVNLPRIKAEARLEEALSLGDKMNQFLQVIITYAGLSEPSGAEIEVAVEKAAKWLTQRIAALTAAAKEGK